MLKNRIVALTRKISPLMVRIALFAVIWCWATLSFFWSGCGANLSDSAYRALQMFALNFEVPEGNCCDEITGLLITRYLAAGFSVFTLITLVSRRFRDWMRKVVQCHSGKRAVLLGFGQVNRMLADALLDQAYQITVVDQEFNEADLEFAKTTGALLMQIDLTKKGALDSVRLDKAARIFVACGSDALNVKIGSLAARLIQASHDLHFGPGTVDDGSSPQVACDENGEYLVRVHIASPKFMYDLSSASDVAVGVGTGMSFFSIKTAAARVLVTRARLALRARDAGCARAHIVIVGAGELAEAIVCDAALAGVSNAVVPRFTLIDQDTTVASARFRARYPSLMGSEFIKEAGFDPEFIERDVCTLDFENDADLAALDGQDDPPTCWIFACRDDEVNLEASMRLEAAMHMNRRRPVPVFKRIWQGGVELHPKTSFGASELFGQRSDPGLAGEILERDPDWLAKRIHEGYREDRKAIGEGAATDPDSAPFTRMWNDLPMNGRRTNRLAGYHLPQKLMDLGYDWRGLASGRLPWLPPDAPVVRELKSIKNQDPKTELPQRLDEVANSEHTRWIIDRAIDGWRPSSHRSNRRHEHPNMEEFANIDPPTRRLDLTSLDVLTMLDPVGRPRAYERKVSEINIGELAGFEPDPTTTELVLTLVGGGRVLTRQDQSALRDVLRGFASQDAACRIQIVIAGTKDIDLEKIAPGGTLPEKRQDERSLQEWISSAMPDLAPGIAVDLTYRPDL